MRALAYSLLSVVSVLLLSASSAGATTVYRVWYDDTIYETFEEGDITLGNTLMVPPAWACGIRFANPTHYRFRNEYFNDIETGDFEGAAEIWLGRPGCANHSEVEIDDLGGGTYGPVDGAAFFEVWVNPLTGYAPFYWIDDDGASMSVCIVCLPDSFTYVIHHSVDTLGGVAQLVKQAARDPQQYASVPGAISSLRTQLSKLDKQARAQTATRRTYDQADREATVRRFEDAALRSLSTAAARLKEAAALAGQARFTETFVACDLAATQLDEAQDLFDAAAHSLGR